MIIQLWPKGHLWPGESTEHLFSKCNNCNSLLPCHTNRILLLLLLVQILYGLCLQRFLCVKTIILKSKLPEGVCLSVINLTPTINTDCRLWWLLLCGRRGMLLSSQKNDENFRILINFPSFRNSLHFLNVIHASGIFFDIFGNVDD